jgi:acetyl-CoA carboxylase biotin carboxyl carrier protein
MRELISPEAAPDDGGDLRSLRSPRVGRFSPRLEKGDVIQAGAVLGVLRILNSRFLLVAPEGVSGLVSSVTPRGGVGYHTELLAFRAGALTDQAGEGTSTGSGTSETAEGLVVTAPIDGIFYCRPTPDDPPFASVGDTLAAGQTLGLIEVMKTFNPVKFEGAGLPERAILKSVSVTDLQEVAAGQTLFEVEPA